MITTYGKEIWRSEIQFNHKNGWKISLYCGIIMIFITVFSLYPLYFNTPTFLIGMLILLIIIPIIIFFIILDYNRFFVTYIIMFKNGILIREPKLFKYYKKEFVPFDQITDADYTSATSEYSPNLLFKIKIKSWFLCIFFKNRDVYSIDTKWVSNYRRCKTLILKYKKG